MEKKTKVCKIFLVDDHTLFREGIKELMNGFEGYKVIGEANNGKQLIKMLAIVEIPDIIVLDISMPVMDGYETAKWLKENFPQVKILALSMIDHEQSIIKMLREGVKGYILKDAKPSEFLDALESVQYKGMYFSELVNLTLLNQLNTEGKKIYSSLNEKEMIFLKYVCSEMTYKEVADKMNVAPRTVDGYREALFEKLNVRSRTGLVMYAIKYGIVNL